MNWGGKSKLMEVPTNSVATTGEVGSAKLAFRSVTQFE